jgi:fumarate hydratase class II
LEKKAAEFKAIKKIGRTHLQDAVPMTLGEEFSGYAGQVAHGKQRLADIVRRLSELALGGTAVGTGINTHPEFARRVIHSIAVETGISFTEAANHFQAQATQDTAVETGGALKTLAVGLIKIANDIRWLSSGPRCGLGEINLPPLQPGSSIMPGKINPVIPEAVIQAAFQVIGNDAAITLGGQSGNFELNVALPLIAHNLLQSIHLLSSAARVFAEKCIAGITANPEQCRQNIEKSLALVTALVPHIGYDRAAAIARKAFQTGKTIRQIALEEKILPEAELDELFDSSSPF